MRPLVPLVALSFFAAACGSTKVHTVAGTVTGLAGTGLVLQDNGADDLAVAAAGPFVFAKPVNEGAAYSVTVSQQPTNPSQVCTVAQAGTAALADVKDVAVTCVTSTFKISGTVSGVAGAGLTLQNSGGETVAVASSGAFSFATPVASGQAFAVTVKTQPTAPTQACTVTGGAGTVGAGPVNSVAVTCATRAFKVGGTVTLATGTGLVLQNNGGDDLPLTQTGAFLFATPVLSEQPYLVTVKSQPSLPAQTCVVSAGADTVHAADVTNVSVHCTLNTYPVGGTTSGLLGSGLVLQDNNGDDFAVGANGPFQFATPVASGQPYSVTVKSQPTSPWQTCAVSSGTGGVLHDAITTVSIQCSLNTYAVSGTVTGLAGSGLTLQSSTGEALAVAASGPFSFKQAIPSGSAYTVTAFYQPSSPTQSCTVAKGSGTIADHAITDVAVTCVTTKYMVSANVSGLTGSGLVLQDNGGDDLSVTRSGLATFPAMVASGAPYSVTVKAQPTSPWQTCAVSSPSGTVTNTPVTVNASCSTNNYSLGGTLSNATGSVVLQNNGGNDLIASGASFTFGAVASGSLYSITVKTAPVGQSCTVANGAGTVGGSAVTNIVVTCSRPTLTYPLAGTQDFVRQVSTSNAFDSLSADSVTGKVYFTSYYDNVSTVSEYPDFASYKANTTPRTITLARAFEGTYHVALNGSFYYNATNSNTLIRASLADGSVTASSVLTGAGFHNTAYFNWGGYSDICFYVDLGNLYVIWATPSGGNMNVSWLDPATLVVKQTWTIPKSKMSTGWAFIAYGSVYVGASYSDARVVGRYDLSASTWDPTYANSLADGSATGNALYITQVAFNQTTNRIFEGTQGWALSYPNATH